jgi:hypothetical protein
MKAKIIDILIVGKGLAFVELENGYKLPMWNKSRVEICEGDYVNVSEIKLDEIDEEYVDLVSVSQ